MHGFTVREHSLSVQCEGHSDVGQIVEILERKACTHLTAVCVKAFILAGIPVKTSLQKPMKRYVCKTSSIAAKSDFTNQCKYLVKSRCIY